MKTLKSWTGKNPMRLSHKIKDKIRDKATARELAKAETRRCVAKLVELRDMPMAYELNLRAAALLLEHGHGRPAQAVTGEDGTGPVQMVVKWQAPDKPAKSK